MRTGSLITAALLVVLAAAAACAPQPPVAGVPSATDPAADAAERLSGLRESDYLQWLEAGDTTVSAALGPEDAVEEIWLQVLEAESPYRDAVPAVEYPLQPSDIERDSQSDELRRLKITRLIPLAGLGAKPTSTRVWPQLTPPNCYFVLAQDGDAAALIVIGRGPEVWRYSPRSSLTASDVLGAIGRVLPNGQQGDLAIVAATSAQGRVSSRWLMLARTADGIESMIALDPPEELAKMPDSEAVEWGRVYPGSALLGLGPTLYMRSGDRE